MRDHLYDRILGCLATAVMGDAMGAATEQWSTPEIIEHYGGLVRELYEPPVDTFAYGNRAGEATDDTSQMFAMAQAIIECDGELTVEKWTEALLHWAATSRHADNMGPTTREVVAALREGRDPRLVGTVGSSTRQRTSIGTSNGAAMRIAPAGLIHPGDLEGACQTALVTCLPTHGTQIAVSGACAIAAGVAEAMMPGADVLSVLRACLDGARRGEELGARHGRYVSGARVTARIELAASLVLRAQSLEEAMALIESHVGNSVMMAEAAPAAVGLFVYADGDPLESIVGSTNIGNDPDTIAAMAGMLAGALKGFGAVPKDLYATVRAANDEDIEAIAEGLTEIALRNLERQK